jgi:hypothetical protein
MMQAAIEVVTEQFLAPGVIAHRRGGVLYGHQYFGHNGTIAIAKEFVFTACRPVDHQDKAYPTFSYSGGWASLHGAAPCRAKECFGAT